MVYLRYTSRRPTFASQATKEARIMEDSERWAFLYANPAVLDLGWFPPAEEVPELQAA